MRYLAPTFLAAVLVASAADGQPLYDWTIDAPQPVSSAATTGALTGPDLTASRPVAVDLDLLRSGPGLLAFPLPDGDRWGACEPTSRTMAKGTSSGAGASPMARCSTPSH